MLARIGAENPFEKRDKALMLVLYSTGMTLSEVGNLKVHNVLHSDGRLREDFTLITDKSKRSIHWVRKWVEKPIEDYVHWRKTTHPDQVGCDGFLGEDLNFFVDDSGLGFKESAVREVKGKIYSSSTELSLLIREIHQKYKVPGGNAESARRSFSVWLALGHFTGTPVHIDWIRMARGDQRLSTTLSAIEKDLPEEFSPIAGVFKSAIPLRFSI